MYFLNIFLTAAVSALGAFVPILFLLCIHFRFRTTYFKERKKRNIDLIEACNKLAGLSDVYIQAVYKETGAKDYRDFSQRIRDIALITVVNRQLDEKIKNLENANELAIENNYIDTYDFKTYLGTILDRKYPDRYLK